MKKVIVSIGSRAPFTTMKKSDIESLFEQMCFINNNFHGRPDISFTITSNSTGKTVKVDFTYFDSIADNATHNGFLWLNEMVDILLADIA